MALCTFAIPVKDVSGRLGEWLLPGSAGLSLHRQRDPAQVTGVEVVQLAWEVVSR